MNGLGVLIALGANTPLPGGDVVDPGPTSILAALFGARPIDHWASAGAVAGTLLPSGTARLRPAAIPFLKVALDTAAPARTVVGQFGG